MIHFPLCGFWTTCFKPLCTTKHVFGHVIRSTACLDHLLVQLWNLLISQRENYKFHTQVVFRFKQMPLLVDLELSQGKSQFGKLTASLKGVRVVRYQKPIKVYNMLIAFANDTSSGSTLLGFHSLYLSFNSSTIFHVHF